VTGNAERENPAMAGTDPQVERLLDLLARNGGRRTPGRRAIIEAFVRADDHLTAEELTVLVQRTAPDLNPSTVYRVLEALEAAGAADRAEAGRDGATWHLVAGAHHHLKCSSCGRVDELAADQLVALAGAVDEAHGFELADHQVLVGRCARCRAR